MSSRCGVAAALAVGVVLLAAAGPAQGARARSTVLDQVSIALTHDREFEDWANLAVLRSSAGEAVVVESRPERTDAGSAWVLRVFRSAYWEGDIVMHEVGYGFLVADPASVQLGTLDVLSGPAQEPVEMVSVSFHASDAVALEELMFVYEGVSAAFVPVAQTEGGWVFAKDRP